MHSLPIFLKLANQPCLVVGGTLAAARKADLLLRAGGSVTVLATALHEEFTPLRANPQLAVDFRPFTEDDLNGKVIVFAASDDEVLDRQVSSLAMDRGLPVNVPDRLELCSFVMPSIIDRSPVVAAISSGGVSPVLARLIRARLETTIPAAFGRLAELAGEFRKTVKNKITNSHKRRSFWESILQGHVAELVYAGKDEDARVAMEAAIQSSAGIEIPRGEVYLVGAGPGDPDLLTFRALRLMNQADIVVYDRLVSDAILNLTRRDARRIYAGKERGHHTLAQQDINGLLVTLAKEGNRVLRLKGGDPFIFGRGGEEIEQLAEHGIPFQVVPGITAAAGCAAYAGIPLTHRDFAQSCVFVTGHLRDGQVNLDWEQLIQPQQTIVIYMGLIGLATICAQLVAHGMDPQTPAALIEQGTTPSQRVLVASVASLPDLAEKRQPKPPTLVIIGGVVRLREKLDWFQPSGKIRPLVDPDTAKSI